MLCVSQYISERDLDTKILMISCFKSNLTLPGSQKQGRERIHWTGTENYILTREIIDETVYRRYRGILDKG